MSLVVTAGSESNWEPPKQTGWVPAICCGVFDLGMQESTWNGETSMKHQLVIAWELNEKIESDDNPFKGQNKTISRTYTASLGDKAKLTEHLESWRGREFTDQEKAGFDVEKLRAVQCRLNLMEYTKRDGNKGVRIAGIAPADKSDPMMTVTVPDDWMPGWVKKKLGLSEEGQDAPAEKFEDDVPF